MDIIMLAIIGGTIEAGAIYWICFTVYTTVRVIKAIIEIISENLYRK